MNTIAWLPPAFRKQSPIVCLTLSLALGACTSDHALGAVADPDGSADHQAPANPDGSADHQAPADAMDATDAPLEIQCVDNGVSYHLGDVIPRGDSACPSSCRCLAGGVIGQCTGACPRDAAADADLRNVAAIIRVGRTAITPEVDVVVYTDGSADRTIIGDLGVASGSPKTYDAGSPEGTMFLSDLAAVGDPSAIVTVACPKAVSNGSSTIVIVGGTSSGDLDCMANPTPADTALRHDCRVLLGTDDPSFLTVAYLCLSTMGQASSAMCCASGGDIPDSCATGACGCSLANSHRVTTCACPAGGCFLQPYGCVGPAGVCTVGADQSCNDNIALSSLHGQCVAGGHCTCKAGFTLLASGKCS